MKSLSDMSDDELRLLYKEAKMQTNLQNVLQSALKVSSNSFYGVFLQQGFMFYEPRIGEAITLTGQYIIKHVGATCDKRFNEFFKTKDYQYTRYSDTDSIFFSIANIVEKHWGNQPDLKIVDAIDSLVEKHLRPFINEATDTIAATQNHAVKTIYFKRENICAGGFWCSKKKYALKVYDSEGVRFPEGDYKIMGIEVVRSSTPVIAREALRQCVIHIIDKDIEGVRKVVNDTHNVFLTAPPEDIAFPRSANNLAEYSSMETIYSKGCPIAVRGALLYNHYIKEYNIDDRYTPICEGDKLRFIYLKEPNTIKENIISFIDELPKEFGLHKYIDRELQFEKVFMAPLNTILSAVKWELEEKSTLDDFFG